MNEIGLFFGTFNPIHVGHLIIADFVAQSAGLREVRLVVTPQNPHKHKSTLLADHHRLEMVHLAVEGNPRLRAEDVEFRLPKPSYTVDTLAYLTEKYPDRKFVLIMGEDNLRTLHKWKNYQVICEHHKILVYPRMDPSSQESEPPAAMGEVKADILRLDAPHMQISSSFVRRAIADGLDVRYILTEPVYRYINDMNFYRRK